MSKFTVKEIRAIADARYVEPRWVDAIWVFLAIAVVGVLVILVLASRFDTNRNIAEYSLDSSLIAYVDASNRLHIDNKIYDNTMKFGDSVSSLGVGIALFGVAGFLIIIGADIYRYRKYKDEALQYYLENGELKE